MNLVIVDHVNKKYHPYIHVSEKIELFICNNIIKINAKNNTCLVVQTDIDLNHFKKREYKMDQGLFDNLILKYNDNLTANEKPLQLWIRD